MIHQYFNVENKDENAVVGGFVDYKIPNAKMMLQLTEMMLWKLIIQ